MDKYQYPDVNDQATLQWIAETEPYKNYWRLSDEYEHSFVENILQDQTFARMIDVGCGPGAMTRRYHKYFNEIVALDPDSARLAELDNWLKINKIAKAKTVGQDFLQNNIPDNCFDVVFCSHVIQHISGRALDPFFSEFRRILKTGGLFVLFTTHSRENHDTFLKTVIKNGKVVEPVISGEEFESLVENDEGVLPCRLFSMDTLEKHLADYHVIVRKVSHALYPRNILDAIIMRDKMINLPFLQRNFGCNVIYICRK